VQYYEPSLNLLTLLAEAKHLQLYRFGESACAVPGIIFVLRFLDPVQHSVKTDGFLVIINYLIQCKHTMNKLLDAKLNLFTKCRVLKNYLKP
jgi:hypothetical protein